ncbi:integrase [Cucumis melo var. makuwa]|uniref:Integrase n=1 Tax=Cucumis melo var. makuwa TaxID=1194695 RepID=A0A5A7V567_CUCMM|nr:integrase [Cucumis melo var. makuwa]TYK08832.1 integrase [Cucumis melo var. makuwa]
MQTSLRGDSHGRRGGSGRRGGGINYNNRSGVSSENSQESCSLSRGRGSRRGRCFSRIQGGGREPTWNLDSGCSNQMTGNRSIFFTYDKSFQSEVKTDDNTRLQVKGQVDILVKTKKDAKQVIDVFYVPGLKHNLLSTGQLLQQGLKVSFEDDICAIKDQTGVLITKVIVKILKLIDYIILCQDKIIISRDVIFNEDESWNWCDDVDEAKIPFHVNIDENKVAQEFKQAEIQRWSNLHLQRHLPQVMMKSHQRE